ncbi:MAG TPA: tetratricopeptide repeat protein [Mycobacteriales bacterium]|nr:tetratricopeptide repeat protein [Mycobacteriales bacterium]
MAPSLLISRGAVCAAIVSTGLLFWTSADEPVYVIKLSALLLCTILGLAAALSAGLRTRRLALPWSLPALAGVALLVAVAVSALVAPHGTTAVLGSPGRYSGLLAYGAGILLFLLILQTFTSGSVFWIAVSILAVGITHAAYGLLQNAGLDPVDWAREYDPVISTLGNPDFASAAMGIAIPLAAWGALRAGTLALRVASAAGGLLALTVALSSSAVQGPLAAGAGLLVVAVAAGLEAPAGIRRLVLGGSAAGAALGGTLLALGLAGIGPLASLFGGVSYQARRWYWAAAVEMFQREPATGVGLDSYGLAWRHDRPLEAARALGGDHFSNAAHNVPLQQLAQGGLLLGLTYLAFVALVAFTLVRGLARLRGERRLLLAGLGGAWVAYQVQSLVSIDQVTLLVLHFVLAGAVVVAADASPLRLVRVGGPPAARAAGGVAVVGLALWACVLAMQPFRASTAVFQGQQETRAGNGDAAVAAYDRALDLTPGRGRYWAQKAQTYNLAGDYKTARELFLTAYRRDPIEVSALQTAAQFADQDGDFDTARLLFTELVGADPTNDKAVIPAATFELRHGGAARARELMERLARDLPGNGDVWAVLGDARLVLGDRSGAKAAYDRALELIPDQPTALAGLGKLR